jgi:hypothetical protein
LTTSPRWKHRPPGSNWGDFGPDDELGRVNLITQEKVKQGVAEVKEGRAFCLSLPLDYPGGRVLNPRRFPPVLSPTKRGERENFNFPLSLGGKDAWTDVVSDDAALIALQYSTQWDSFAHVGGMFDADGDGTPEMLYYNGWKAGVDVVGPVEHRPDGERKLGEHVGARKMGVETMAEACLQGRAVMIDLFAHFGRERKYVGYDDLRRVIEADGVTVEEGDMVCLRTGFDRLLLEMKKDVKAEIAEHACAVLDGRDEKLLQWVTDSGASVLISDNYAVEGVPAREGTGHRHASMPLHEHCLFKLGVHLGELWYLSELADWLRSRKRSRFLLTAPPLRLPGAVGSPATPVATV